MLVSQIFSHVFRIVLLIFMAVTVTGCATKGSGAQFTLEEPQTSKAIIYHYRPSSFKGSALQWDVISNGIPLTRIGNGGYFKEIATPGRIAYLTKDNRKSPIGLVDQALQNAFADFQETYTIDVEAGKTYFLKWSFLITKGNIPHIEHIPAEEALKELNGLLSFPPAKRL